MLMITLRKCEKEIGFFLKDGDKLSPPLFIDISGRKEKLK
jgi:hypothetical protein